MGDIVKRLVMDIADWVAPISEAKAHLDGFAGATQQSVGRIGQSFAAMGSAKSSIVDIGNQWNSFLSNTNGVDNYTDATRYLFSTIRSSVGSLGEARTSIRAVGAAWDTNSAATGRAVTQSVAATSATQQLTQAATGQSSAMGSLAQMILGKLPTAYVAYKLAGDEAIGTAQKHLSVNSAMMQSLGSVGSSFSQLVGTISGEFFGGIRSSAESLLQFTIGFTNLSEVVDYGASTVTSWASSTSSALKSATGAAREAGLVFGTALAIWHGADSNQAAAFYEEGQALNALAAETANVISKQEQQRSVLKDIIAASERAAASQKTSAEVSRIGTVSSVDALDAELVALKQRAGSVDANTQKSKEWQAEIAAITGAIEKQRAAIQGGTFKPKEDPVQKMIDDANKQLNQQKDPIQAQIDQAVGAGANAAQVNELRRILEARRDLTEQQKLQADAERESQRLADESNRRTETGAGKISSLKDQIDLMTGAASKGEIAMRELSRQGYDETQIAEIGKLTDELNKLQDNKPGSKSAKDAKQGDNEAVLEGSKKTAELLLRGVNGTSSNDPSVNEQKKTNQHLSALVSVTKANKPPELKIID